MANLIIQSVYSLLHITNRSSYTSNSRNHLKIREQSGLLTVNVFCLTMLRRFNQVVVSYDASKEERVEALERRHKEVEERLKEKTKALTLDDWGCCAFNTHKASIWRVWLEMWGMGMYQLQAGPLWSCACANWPALCVFVVYSTWRLLQKAILSIYLTIRLYFFVFTQRMTYFVGVRNESEGTYTNLE